MLYNNSNGKKIEYVKVFGERNSGTNFLNRLLSDSLDRDITILEHSPNTKSHEILRSYFFRNPYYTWTNRDLLLEHLIDIQRQEEFSESFGWKHAHVHEKLFVGQPKAINTLFIFLVRNPWRVIGSLAKNPYHLHPRPSRDLRAFVSQSFIPMSRDGFSVKGWKKPADFWNSKNGSYLTFCKSNTSLNFVFARYEDLLLDIDGFFERLASTYNLTYSISIPPKSVKKSSSRKSTDDFRKEVIGFSASRYMGLEIANQIYEGLDKQLLEEFSYYLD